MKIHYSELCLCKLSKNLYHAWLPNSPMSYIRGAGNTADNAIRDWRKQYNLQKRDDEVIDSLLELSL
jgi:hypothetical protein